MRGASKIGTRPQALPARIAVAALLALAALVSATPAAGAAAYKLTEDPAAGHPDVAVDAAGTAHVVWNQGNLGADDVLFYCRVPRGAHACADTRSFALPLDSTVDSVNLMPTGEVVLTSERCCFPGNRVYAFSSDDGGTTFSAPQLIAERFYGWGGEVEPGPGNFSLSLAGGGGGCNDGLIYSAVPLGGTTSAFADLSNNDCIKDYYASIGFTDALTPMVAYGDLDNIYFRRWGSSGDYNDVTTWLREQAAGPGDEPKLASGLRGVFMIYIDDTYPRDYWVSRYDPAVDQFTGAKRISGNTKDAPIFRDFFEDAGGTLHATFLETGEDATKGRDLIHRISLNGTKWEEPELLGVEKPAGLYDLRIGAAPEGDGAVVADGNGQGPIYFAPFGPAGGGDGACVPQVAYGKAIALAREGCFAKNGQTYTTSDAVRLNGFDLQPGGEIVIDKGDGTMKSTGKVLVQAGDRTLDEQKLAWKLPKSGGPLKDPAGNPVVFDAGKAGVDFLGLPVSGWVSPQLIGGGASELPVNLRLPDPFGALLGGGVTGSTILHLDNTSGLVLDGAELHGKDVFLGLAELKNLFLKYIDDPFLLQGGADLVLPVVNATLGMDFGLRNGDFDYGSTALDFDPGLPVAAEYLLLQHVGALVATNPTRIEGDARATAGEELSIGGADYALATIKGSASYTFTDPGEFLVQGDGQILNIPVTSVEARYLTSGLLSVAANVDIGAGFGPSIEADVDGQVSLASGAFNLSGSGGLCGVPLIPGGCAGSATVLASSKAAVGCVDFDANGPAPGGVISVGLAYVWDSGFDLLYAGCDLSDYKVALSAAKVKAARAADAPLGFHLGKGLPQADVAIEGQGGAPQVTLTGPNGETVSSPAPPQTTSSGPAGVSGTSGTTTFFALPDPAPGDWAITPQAGSAPIARVLEADGLPKPKVKARVRRGKGRKRTLVYRVRKLPGQRIRFVELGPGSAKTIGTAKGKRGTLAFSAADGPGGKRMIEAQVESFGLPRAERSVASYKAPPPIKPSKPRGLRVRRRGSTALVSWRRARYAKRYVVQVKLRDGRLISQTTKRTHLKLGRVPGIDAAKIRVAGLKSDNTHGKVARAKLKPQPKRRQDHG